MDAVGWRSLRAAWPWLWQSGLAQGAALPPQAPGGDQWTR